MKHKLFFLILAFGLIQFMSCTDDDDFDPSKEQLPLATTTGANTFGFLLNGETWLPHVSEHSNSPIKVTMDKDSIFMFSINLVSNKINRNENIKILLKCNKPGPYVPTIFTFVDNHKKLGCQVYDLNSKNLQFDITNIDFIGQIISGNFQIIGSSSSCGDDMIDVTNGVFDCKFSR